jgi:hypothetical protein
MWCSLVLQVVTKISEEIIASIFRVQTLVTAYKTTRRHKPEDHNRQKICGVFAINEVNVKEKLHVICTWVLLIAERFYISVPLW